MNKKLIKTIIETLINEQKPKLQKYIKLDIQNGYKYANHRDELFGDGYTAKQAQEEFKDAILYVLALIPMYGPGFTSLTDEKLDATSKYYAESKIKKFRKVFAKTYGNILNDQEIDKEMDNLVFHLKNFTAYAHNMWKEGKGVQFLSLDEKYYEYAKKDLTAFLKRIK